MESYWEKGRLAVGKKENDLRQIGKNAGEVTRNDDNHWCTNRSQKKTSRIIRRDDSRKKEQRNSRRDEGMRMNGK